MELDLRQLLLHCVLMQVIIPWHDAMQCDTTICISFRPQSEQSRHVYASNRICKNAQKQQQQPESNRNQQNGAFCNAILEATMSIHLLFCAVLFLLNKYQLVVGNIKCLVRVR